jgi:beta-glucosidase/6-phospho-beta-glucosidase/beta-galactosidase
MLEKLGTFLYRVPDEKEIFAAGKGDYLNLNVYARRYVTNWNGSPTCAKVDPVGGGVAMEGQIVAPLFETLVDATVPHNQWGREILPRIMHDSLIDIMERYGNPVVLTENGHGSLETPDKNGYVEDNDRIKVIEAFLESLSEARREGSNVRGYYIWSAMDLYSWVNGYKKRYGLVRVDFDHGLTRIPKKSWAWYRDFILQDTARRTDA